MATPSSRRMTRDSIIDAGILLALSLLAYLPILINLGFYTDDWYVIWGGMQRGLVQIIRFYFVDRPFMGLPFAATFAALGSTPIFWHVYACLLRFLGGLAFLWLLRQLWPGQRLASLFSAGLFVVYPGFLSQPKAVTYQLNILALDFGVLSLGLTTAVLHLKGRITKAILTLLGVGSALFCYLMFEYMMGIELVRLFLIVFFIWKKPDMPSKMARAWRVVKSWLPNLVGITPFLVWRIFFYVGARKATDLGALKSMYLSNPMGMGLRLILETPKDWIATTFLAWGVPFYNLTEKADYSALIYALAAALIGGVLLLAYTAHLRKRGMVPRDEEANWTKSGLLLGGLGTLATLLPILLAGRDVYFADAYDHYSLQAAPFVGLFLVAGVFAWFKPRVRVWVLSLLIASGLVTQNANSAVYGKAWEYQRQLWWQLSWRAPDLKDNAVLVPLLPSGYAFREGFEIWSPANLIYNPGEPNLRVVGIALDQQTLLQLLRFETFGAWFRGIEYTVQTSNSLVMSLPSGGSCLHVLDGSSGELSDNEIALARLVAPKSRTNLIVTDAQTHQPPEKIFGQEPAHGWCYYYQQASLARQRQDWTAIATLGDKASQNGLVPKDMSEWMPFYVGYAHMNRIDDANILGGYLRTDAAFINNYCSVQSSKSYGDGIEEYIVTNLCVGFESSN